MKQDFFEFQPQFKLMIVGNHKPSLRGVDEAMRRRLHLIPFTVTIPEVERDQELPEKLHTEWPAILRWAMDGCLEWQREGLNPPAVVTDATRAYLESEDAITLWVEDCTEPDANGWEPTGILFASWKRWAERAGEFVGSQKRFSGLLEERGLKRHRQPGTGTRGYYGLRVAPVEDASGRWEP
jgi:putative DNA primase/helicase